MSHTFFLPPFPSIHPTPGPFSLLVESLHRLAFPDHPRSLVSPTLFSISHQPPQDNPLETPQVLPALAAYVGRSPYYHRNGTERSDVPLRPKSANYRH